MKFAEKESSFILIVLPRIKIVIIMFFINKNE